MTLAGWISLHHAALTAPPTLVSHLLTHGCSPLSVTRRNLTALDIVTASTTLPGREDVALLLEEAMREHGWTGGRMEERRRSTEKRLVRLGKQKDVQEDINKALNIDPRWWGDPDLESLQAELLDDEDEENMGDPDLLVSSHVLVCRVPCSGICTSDSPARLQLDARVLSSRIARHFPITHNRFQADTT